jgi:hypothetical protein
MQLPPNAFYGLQVRLMGICGDLRMSNDALRAVHHEVSGRCGFDKDIYMMLAGHIDESISGENPPLSFALSCVFAEGSEWGWASLAWRKVIDDKNRELVAAGRKPVERFHAVDLNSFAEDFEDWNGSERTAFILEIIKRVFGRHEIFSFGYTVSLRDIAAVWPEYVGKEISAAYYSLTKLIMLGIANPIENLFSLDTRISLIYERCPYGAVMLEAFNSIVDDVSYRSRNLFTTIAPMGWEECTPLQPADFLAYEIMKENHRLEPEVIAVKERGRRGSLSALLDFPIYFGEARHVVLKNLQNLKEGANKRAASIVSSAEI